MSNELSSVLDGDLPNLTSDQVESILGDLFDRQSSLQVTEPARPSFSKPRRMPQGTSAGKYSKPVTFKSAGRYSKPRKSTPMGGIGKYSKPVTFKSAGRYSKPGKSTPMGGIGKYSKPVTFKSAGRYSKPGKSTPMGGIGKYAGKKSDESTSRKRKNSTSALPSGPKPKVMSPNDAYLNVELSDFLDTQLLLNGDPYNIFGLGIYFIRGPSRDIPNDILRVIHLDALCHRYVSSCPSINVPYVNEAITNLSKDDYLMVAKCDEIFALVQATLDKKKREIKLNLICTSPSGYYENGHVVELRWRIGMLMAMKMMKELKENYFPTVELFSLEPASFRLVPIYYNDGWRIMSITPSQYVHEHTCPSCQQLATKASSLLPNDNDSLALGERKAMKHMDADPYYDGLIKMGITADHLDNTIHNFVINLISRLSPRAETLKQAVDNKLTCYRRSTFDTWLSNIAEKILKSLYFNNIKTPGQTLEDIFSSDVFSSTLNARAYERFMDMYDTFKPTLSTLNGLSKRDTQHLYLVMLPLYVYIMYAVYYQATDKYYWKTIELKQICDAVCAGVPIKYDIYFPENNKELSVMVIEYCDRFLKIFTELRDYVESNIN